MVISSAPSVDDAPVAFRDGSVHLDLDLRVYRLTAVQKTAYRLASRCTAAFGAITGDSLHVVLSFAPAVPESEALAATRLFYRELLDQELREKVGEETSSLRSLLLAVAFSRTGLPLGE